MWGKFAYTSSKANVAIKPFCMEKRNILHYQNNLLRVVISG